MVKKEISLGGENYLVIDLTEPLREDVEVFPGDPKLKKEIFSRIYETGYQHHVYRISDHAFHPHGDAPKHQNPELQKKGFEKFSLDFNPACLIDLEGLVEIDEKHLEPHSELISRKKAVLIRTGYDRWLEENKRHIPDKIPYLNKSAADFLSEFDLRVVGIDSLTVDPIGEHYAHQKFKNLLIVESLVHLHEIPVESRGDFDLQTSPVRIVGATGGPVVAYAFIR